LDGGPLIANNTGELMERLGGIKLDGGPLSANIERFNGGPLPGSQNLLCSSIDRMDLNEKRECVKSDLIDLNSPD